MMFLPYELVGMKGAMKTNEFEYLDASSFLSGIIFFLKC